MRAESSAENTSCSLSRPRDREKVPSFPFSLILFLSPSPSTSLLSTLLLLPSLLISPFYNVALSLLSMPVKYTFYHSRSFARLFSFLRHLFLFLSLSPSLSIYLSPVLSLSLHHRRLSRLHSFSSTRLNLGNPFSSHTEIPRRTAFSLFATFHLLLLLPLLCFGASSSFSRSLLFVFVLFGANPPF